MPVPKDSMVVHQLHNALYGASAEGRSESLSAIWGELIAEVEQLAELRRSLPSEGEPANAMRVVVSTVEATFVREAISVALKATPDIFDAEQVDALTLVENRLCHATDRALAERRHAEREALRERLEELHDDPEFQARLNEHLEQNRAVLDGLAEND